MNELQKCPKCKGDFYNCPHPPGGCLYVLSEPRKTSNRLEAFAWAFVVGVTLYGVKVFL